MHINPNDQKPVTQIFVSIKDTMLAASSPNFPTHQTRTCTKRCNRVLFSRDVSGRPTALPRHVEATEEFIHLLQDKHAAKYQLTVNGRQVRPREAPAETHVLEYATPDIVKKAGFKPRVLGMMEQVEKLTAAQTRYEDRLRKTEDDLADTRANVEFLRFKTNQLVDKKK